MVSRREITSTREEIHGLLRLEDDRLVIQWRASVEVSRVGREIRTDRELAPLREVSVPLSGLAGARVHRRWRNWLPRQVVVLNAADLRAFDALAGEGGVSGLVLEHPAEMVLEIRGADSQVAREFTSELALAVSEHLLQQATADAGRDLSASRPARLPGPGSS